MCRMACTQFAQPYLSCCSVHAVASHECSGSCCSQSACISSSVGLPMDAFFLTDAKTPDLRVALARPTIMACSAKREIYEVKRGAAAPCHCLVSILHSHGMDGDGSLTGCTCLIPHCTLQKCVYIRAFPAWHGAANALHEECMPLLLAACISS